MSDTDQNINTDTQADQIIDTALHDEAGAEAMEAQELQGDDAPVNDATATGDITDQVNPDQGAAQNLDGVDENVTNTEQLVEAEQPVAKDVDVSDSATDTEEVSEAVSEAEEALNSDDHPDAKWFVVHTYSGHENKVSTTLKQKVASEHLEAFIFDVLVPTQNKIEIRSGKKETVKEKIFPGYILVKMILNDDAWLAVRTTPGVTSFVGMGNKPTPIPEAEVRTIVKFMSQGASPTFKDVYMENDTVKIIEGPFAQFIGKVDSVDKDRGKVRVLVSIFGRETPVELDFLQVQKL